VEPVEQRRFGDREIEALFAPLSGASTIVLAVSGGPDSLALLLLMRRWRDLGGAPPAIHVLTVDHRLHPRSAEDAAFVAATAEAHGFPTRILVRAGLPPLAGIEAAARAARYRLLIDAAKEIGASHIVLAHHRDDQAETFLMRLAGGSGIHGLAAMRRLSEREGLFLFRPFLDIPKSRLARVVREAGIEAVDDAANRDPRFLRTKLRAMMPELARVGLGPERLTEIARQMAGVADAIDAQASALLSEAVTVDDYAVARLAVRRYAEAPEEIRHRALTRLLQAIGGVVYPPRGARLAGLDRAVAGTGDVAFRRTLAGVVAERAGEAVLFYREIGRAGLPVVPVREAFAGPWDHRFHLQIRHKTHTGLEIGSLGFMGTRKAGPLPSGLPRGAIAALPAIRRGEKLIGVPVLDGGMGLDADLDATAKSLIGARIFGRVAGEATVN
jgi:tRNA(Ile)-lysidine synthase